ncbi:MAG: SIS domain-containing protein [Nitrososphaerota archaeon]|nr:SIS domain-containing protein [Nitrososphaerota archaeon]
MPGSFESTLRQIQAQEFDIPEYISILKSQKIQHVDPSDTVFCGAGDSLACARFVERLMNFEPRSVDPYDLLLYPRVGRGKKLYFVSVSGMTQTNITAAAAFKEHAKETIAITANPKSELAKSCSEIIELKFTQSHGLTPGTNSFTASLLACSMLFKTPPRIDVSKMLKEAKDWALKIPKTNGTFHFVGSGSFYAIAMYGAAKIYEFAGGPADYQLTEEFSHLNLFATKKDDLVVILSYGREDSKAEELNSNLKNKGFKSEVLPLLSETEHVLQRAIYYSLCLQYLALHVAQSRAFKQPAFLQNKKLLDISNRMIY